jgi:hypothetical protein
MQMKLMVMNCDKLALFGDDKKYLTPSKVIPWMNIWNSYKWVMSYSDMNVTLWNLCLYILLLFL